MCRIACIGRGKSRAYQKDTGTIPEEGWWDQCNDGREA